MELTEYLELITKQMVKHPHEVLVAQSQDAMGVLLTLQVNKEDMAIIVGKQGETAKSIRNIVRIAGFIKDARVSVKILEPNK